MHTLETQADPRPAERQPETQPVIRQLAEVEPEILYGFERQVLFSPSAGGSRSLKFAFVKGRPGASSKPHTHPGGELALTLEGGARLVVHGQAYDIAAGTALSVPPDVRHPAEAVGEADWLVVTTYCDECALMRDHKRHERAAGLPPQTTAKPVVRLVAEVPAQAWGGCDRQVLFSPSIGNSTFMTLSLTRGSPGARTAWQAPGCDEIALTLQGQAVLTGPDTRHHLAQGASVSLQGRGEWHAEVVGDGDWLAVTGSCEECPLVAQNTTSMKG